MPKEPLPPETNAWERRLRACRRRRNNHTTEKKCVNRKDLLSFEDIHRILTEVLKITIDTERKC